MGEYKVYCHTNKINGKKYIGITKLRPSRRWSNGRGYKECSYFYNAIKKYGWNNFHNKILYKNLTIDEAEKLEVKLISELNTLAPNGYNLQTGGNLNRSVSKLTREKMSKSHSGKTLSDEHIEKIRKSLLGRKRTPEQIENIRQGQIGKTLTEEHKQAISDGLKDNTKRKIYKKPVSQYTLDGEFIRNWESATDVAREVGFCRRSIQKCCSGEQMTSCGFKWKWLNGD